MHSFNLFQCKIHKYHFSNFIAFSFPLKIIIFNINYMWTCFTGLKEHHFVFFLTGSLLIWFFGICWHCVTFSITCSIRFHLPVLWSYFLLTPPLDFSASIAIVPVVFCVLWLLPNLCHKIQFLITRPVKTDLFFIEMHPLNIFTFQTRYYLTKFSVGHW